MRKIIEFGLRAWLKITRMIYQRISPELLVNHMAVTIRNKSETVSPFESLKLLFNLDNILYQCTGNASVRFGDGEHSKHRHTRYHDFFIENIDTGAKVLDVGCGKGELAADIASRVEGVNIYAIDIVQDNIEKAKERNSSESINFVCGDVMDVLPEENFDTIVLSNVLEHIEERVKLLKMLKSKCKPDKILIRVPLFTRDWRVPLKRELGVEYRLDDTHFIEYTQEEFDEEIAASGLKILAQKTIWGEIWAVTE